MQDIEEKFIEDSITFIFKDSLDNAGIMSTHKKLYLLLKAIAKKGK